MSAIDRFDGQKVPLPRDTTAMQTAIRRNYTRGDAGRLRKFAALALHATWGLTFAEIGKILGQSESTASRQARHAAHEMRGLFEPSAAATTEFCDGAGI